MNSPTCSQCDCVKGCSANLSLCPILVAECIASSQVSAAQHRVIDAPIAQQEQPIAYALQWPTDSRINLGTVFDTWAEAIDYKNRCGTKEITVVPLYAAAQHRVLDAAITQPLPLLPERGHGMGYTAEQMKAYALQAIAQPEQTAPVRQPLTPEKIDTAYRLVWSTVPHAERITAFAHEIYKITGGRT